MRVDLSGFAAGPLPTSTTTEDGGSGWHFEFPIKLPRSKR
jgi:hypothetical protein